MPAGDKPEITVLMTVYNGEPYLREAVESILGQTYRDFEFLVLDNVSTDQSREIIQSYNDPRIRLICNKENLGQTGALNLGLQLASGKFIARMDADDISHPSRLEKQVACLKSDGSIAAVGLARMISINEKGRRLRTDLFPTGSEAVAKFLIYASPFPHSSVTMRKDAVEDAGGYSTEVKFCQDWSLWSKFAAKGLKLESLPSPLHYVRLHAQQTTHTFKGGRRDDEMSNQLHSNIRAFTSLAFSLDEVRSMHCLWEADASLTDSECLDAIEHWKKLSGELYGLNASAEKSTFQIMENTGKALLKAGRNRMAREAYSELIKSKPLSRSLLLGYLLSLLSPALSRKLLELRHEK